MITKIPLKDEKNKSPCLDIFKLNKINRLIKNSQYKNSVLYNKIIQPYNNTKTLLNNNISYKTPMIKYINNNNIIQDKNIKNKNTKNKEKESTLYVRRIILEEKYTIDSKGDKKTIYVKKISPAIKIKKIRN